MARSRRRSADEILKLASDLRDRYRERDHRLDVALDYFHNSGLLVQTEENMYRVRVPDMGITADLIADLIAAQEIKVMVPPLGDSMEAKRRANQLERFFAAWLNYIRKEEDINLVHEMAYDAICYGAIVGRIVYRRNGYDFPISIQLRNWRHLYPVFHDNRLCEIVEAYPALIGDVRYQFDVGLSGYDDNDEVTVYEYWDEERSAIWIDATRSRMAPPGPPQWIRKPAPHGYGCMPYFLRFVRPRSRDRIAPEYMAPSLLQSWLPSIQIINLLESARLSGYLAYVNGAWAVKTTNPDFELDLTAGAVNFLRPDETIEPIVRGPVGADLAQATAEWKVRFQQASVPTALYGDVPNVTAGYAISLLTDAGRRILIPIAKAISMALSDACCRFTYVADALMRPTQGEVAITAIVGDGFVDKIVMPPTKQVFVEIEIGDPLPRDKERSVNMAIAMRTPNKDGMPLMSDETIRELVLNVPDNEAEIRRILRERMMATMSGILLADAVQEVVSGLDATPETTPGAPPGVPPGAPPGVPPGAALQAPIPEDVVPSATPNEIVAPTATSEEALVTATNDPLIRAYLEALQQMQETGS
jgi:hypothetical protein